MSSAAEVVVLPGFAQPAGAVVVWRLSGEVLHAELARAWAAAGLEAEMLPLPPAPETALRRAMDGLASRRILRRPLRERGRWALVAETVGESDSLTHEVTLRCGLNAVGAPTFEPLDHDLVGTIRRAFNEQLGRLGTEDISSWLTGRVLPSLRAVPIRDGGGVYFVPPAAMPRWKTAVAALQEVSGHRMGSLPAFRTDEVMAWVLDSVEREAAVEADAMERELGEEGLGARALAVRSTRCAEVLGKVGEYEELLGQRLEGLRERMGTLQARLAAAALVASAPPEEP